MAVMLQPRSLHAVSQDRGQPTADQLHVQRKDIVFYSVSEERLRIEVTVSNQGRVLSDRARLRLQAAPLGAFLPWTDLTELWVPPLAPGKRVTLVTEVSTPTAQQLGTPDQLPPRRLLTALGMFDDRDKDTAEEQQDSAGWLKSRWQSLNGFRRRRQAPANLLGQLGQLGTHWAGNINVLVGTKAVERHLAQALRIYPGCDNHAIFVVGDGRSDAYSFAVHGTDDTWNTSLYVFAGATSSETSLLAQPVAPSIWYPTRGSLFAMLQIRPPASCECSQVEVHVTRSSTGEKAVVEFSLDPSAQGPGCYTV